MKAVRFNFDQAFDGTVTESARKAAESLETAKAEAFEAGRQSGLAEAEAGINSQAAAAMAGLLDATKQIFSRLDDNIQANMRQASEMALLIARRLAPRLVAERPLAEIEGVIRDCLELCLQEPRLLVRVAEDLVDPMKEQLEDLQHHAGYAGKFVLIGDPEIGICLDTAHLLASGYDIRTPEALEQTLDTISRTTGLDRVKLIHGNDSKAGLGERKDRHEHIGRGKVGIDGFKAVLSRPELKNLNMIVELPPDKVASDIALLKRLRSE